MLLKAVRIRNFRTIAEEINISINRKCALVGPNNSGKTNILRAIHLFFCSYSSAVTNNRFAYKKTRDFPSFVQTGRTTINLIFDCENNDLDDKILDLYSEIKGILSLPVGNSRSVSVLLTFSDIGNPIFQVFPTSKKPSDNDKASDLSQKTEELFEIFFSSLSVHYIQSDKRFDEIYRDLLLPSVKHEIASNFEEIYGTIKRSIDLVNTEINQYMRLIGLSEFVIKLSAPENITDFIKEIEFRLHDEIEGALDSKGMGIQALAVIASMLWLQKFYKRNNKSVIWLIEEPESFLHPNLISAQSKIIDKLSESSSIIYATHALGLVPPGRENIFGVNKTGNQTKITTFKSTFEATTTLRTNLGVRFSDYFQLTELTIAVEGPTDKQYMEWFLNKYSIKIAKNEHSWPNLRHSAIIDYGGVRALQSFVQATYDHIRRESVYVALFDSDEAGVESRKILQRYFQNKQISYESNTDFVSVRFGFAIEGLFSDKIISEIYSQNRKIFDTYSIDSEGTVEPFRINGTSKVDAFKLFTLQADRETGFEWANRFIALCNVLENAIVNQKKRLSKINL